MQPCARIPFPASLFVCFGLFAAVLHSNLLLSNLLVVLCRDRSTQPVLNTDSFVR